MGRRLVLALLLGWAAPLSVTACAHATNPGGTTGPIGARSAPVSTAGASAAQVATTGESVVWIQDGTAAPDGTLPDLVTVQRWAYLLTVDGGTPLPLTASCSGTRPFLCVAPRPAIAAGPHTLVLLARAPEGGEVASAPIAYTALPPPAPPAAPIANINTATAAELAFVRYVPLGTANATRIVAYRTANGPYASVDDLLKAGISPSLLTLIKPVLTVAPLVFPVPAPLTTASILCTVHMRAAVWETTMSYLACEGPAAPSTTALFAAAVVPIKRTIVVISADTLSGFDAAVQALLRPAALAEQQQTVVLTLTKAP